MGKSGVFHVQLPQALFWKSSEKMSWTKRELLVFREYLFVLDLRLPLNTEFESRLHGFDLDCSIFCKYESDFFLWYTMLHNAKIIWCFLNCHWIGVLLSRSLSISVNYPLRRQGMIQRSCTSGSSENSTWFIHDDVMARMKALIAVMNIFKMLC